MCFQAATLLCAYAAARYRKLTIPCNSALAFVAAGILQGFSHRVRTPLGERSKRSYLNDCLSIGFIAYGVSQLVTSCRAKYGGGVALGGTQLLISNAYFDTFFRRVSAIDSETPERREEEKVIALELYAELSHCRDQLSPYEKIRAYRALTEKLIALSDRAQYRGSEASYLLQIYKETLGLLEGWEKAKAQMSYYEWMNQHRLCQPYVDFKQLIHEDGLSPEALNQRDQWLRTTGAWITYRWRIWTMGDISFNINYQTLLRCVPRNNDLTFSQKIDLCDEYVLMTLKYQQGNYQRPFCEKALAVRKTLMDTLEGVEKCKAYIEYVEFLHDNDLKDLTVFNSVFPNLIQELNEEEEVFLNEWLEEEGNTIRAEWQDLL